MSFFSDDISSIEESSSRRERWHSEELSEKDSVIKSLTYAVQRLADTLDTKEEELQMKDRVDVDLECKVLDLMIENAELKNRVTDLEEGAAVQDTPSFQQWKDQRTPATSDDFSSFIQRHHNEKENCENVANEKSLVDSKTIHGNKPPARRSSVLALSKLMPKKLPNLKSGLGGRSLFTKLEGKRVSWGTRSGVFLRLIPRHVSTFNESASDDISDLSSV